VSLCSYARTPDGDHRARLEVNGTALVHGPAKACYSLRRDEMPLAVDALLAVARDLLGDALGPAAWDVHRFDPSITFALPEGTPAAEVVVGAHRAFRLLAEPRHVVSLHNDQTATWIRAKWRSVMVYDKRAEALHKGVVPDVSNLLRVEQRIRPRTATGDWKMARQTNLGDMDALASRTMTDSLQLLGDIGVRMAAGQSLALVQALMRGGASLNAALRLSAVVELERSFGGGALTQLGAAESSAKRWRAEVRKYLEASGGEEAMVESLPGVLEQLVPAFAAEHDVKITKKAKSRD
jgi:hypothetical protein